MSLVLLVIHMMIAAALVGVVLLQKSEGGALGIGGGGGGGFLTGRGTANLLTRTTAFLAAAFFASSLALTILANQTQPSGSILDKVAPVSAPAAPGSAAPAADSAAKPADASASPGEKKPEGHGILEKLQAPPAPLPR